MAECDWQCAECNFLNIPSLSFCDLCEATRPASASPNLAPGIAAAPPQPLEQPGRAPVAAFRPPLAALDPQQPRGPELLHATKPTASPPPPNPPSPPSPPSASPPPPSASAGDPDAEYEAEDFPWSEELRNANVTVFGAGALRPLQLRAANAAIARKDVLVVMPTGAGKSRCFQLPALFSSGLTVVVAPLLSLIFDQVDSLSKRHVRALYLCSTQTAAETAAVNAELRRSPPSCKLLYVTPERLQQSVHLQNALRRLHEGGMLERVVVDEAHCVVSWGRDFRPDYLALGSLRKLLPGVPWSLLTATLPPAMRADLLTTLGVEASRGDERTLVTAEADLDREAAGAPDLGARRSRLIYRLHTRVRHQPRLRGLAEAATQVVGGRARRSARQRRRGGDRALCHCVLPLAGGDGEGG
jgi:hypothetical protein